MGVTNLLCFLVCAVHFGKEIGRQLVLKEILVFSITMKGNCLQTRIPFRISTMREYTVPSEIRRLWGSASYTLSFPPWLPAHTDPTGSLSVRMVSSNYLKVRYIKKKVWKERNEW